MMSSSLRGMRRQMTELDFDLYRVDVPLPGIARSTMSVIDMQPEGITQTLVLIHGFAGCAETWEYQISHFSKRFRVVAPDLRGHGKSDAPFSAYTMDEIVGDLIAMADALGLPEKFVLVGHSFGGSICVEFANKHPDRLEKLVLIATAGEYPLPRLVSLAFSLPSWVYRPFWRFRPAWNAELHVMKRLMLNNLRRWRGWPLMRNIQTETLVITGERDNFFPRFVFEDVGKMIPHAEVMDVGTAKHKVQLERHQAVNRAIERFIESDGRRSSWRDQELAGALSSPRPWLKSYSPGTPQTIPLPRQPLHRFLESAADRLPRRVATIYDGQSLTYNQLNQRVNQLAQAFQGMGVKPGDRVCVLLPSSPQFVIAYYASLKLGGVVVLPNPDASAEGITTAIQTTGAQVLVTLRSNMALAQMLKEQDPQLTVVLADLDAVKPDADERRALRPVAVLMDDITVDIEAETAPPDVNVTLDMLAAVIFTSGTTEAPKGVCLTHGNLVANTMQTRHWVPDIEYGGEIFLSALPLVHSYGMTLCMNVPVAIAATMVFLPRFNVTQALEAIKKHKPTIFPGVPGMYTAINLAPNVRSYGLNSIKACISGAAPLPVEVQESFEKLTRGRLVEGYGLTEASPITHANPLYGQRKVGHIGVPLPNTDAEIVDLKTDKVLPAGQIGELRVRGPQVMRGYWGEKSGTGASKTALRDGWLYTGDLAIMDSEGYFQIVARKQETILSGEFSVYPRDVEEVLYENNKVLEAAVIGMTVDHDQKGNQRVKAYVVPRPGTTLSKEELIALCEKRLDPHAVPFDIEFREALPKSFVGKVLRRMLQDSSS
jgi:long-chain acyl-CoA synthetase